jgi:GxxExxY protein
VADVVVNDLVIVELKAAESLCEEHEAQLTNYLRATSIEVGLLLNFGRTAQFKRKAFSNLYKLNFKQNEIR